MQNDNMHKFSALRIKYVMSNFFGESKLDKNNVRMRHDTLIILMRILSMFYGEASTELITGKHPLICFNNN